MNNQVKNQMDSWSFLCIGTFLVFLFCKLTGNITWSWWWITAPLWGPFVFILAVVLSFLGVYTLVEFLEWIGSKISGLFCRKKS